MVTIRCIDFETDETETVPPLIDIVEVGWTDIIRSIGGKDWVIDQFGSGCPYTAYFCNPGRPIGAQSMAVHHILNAYVEGAPKIEDVLRIPLNPLDDDEVILAAHYAEHEIKALGGPRGFRWIDTWKVAIHLAPQLPSWALQFLRYKLALDVDPRHGLPAHRAGPDSYVCAALLLRMLPKIGVDEMVDISARPALLPRFTFGKHSGEPISEVPSGYLDWILKQRKEDGSFAFDNNVLYTAQAELGRR